MNKVELCIFDMDGLLVDTERYIWIKCEKATLDFMGYQIDESDFYAAMGGLPDLYLDKIIKDHPEFSKKTFYDLCLTKVFQEAEKGEVPLMKGAKQLLDYLKNNNIHIALGTSSQRKFADILLKNTGVIDYFESITTINDVKNAKPAPDIYLSAYNNFNVPKENTLVFEDAHNGCVSALAAGLNLIIVPDLAKITQEDRASAYKVLNSLDEAIEIIEKINC